MSKKYIKTTTTTTTTTIIYPGSSGEVQVYVPLHAQLNNPKIWDRRVGQMSRLAYLITCVCKTRPQSDKFLFVFGSPPDPEHVDVYQTVFQLIPAAGRF